MDIFNFTLQPIRTRLQEFRPALLAHNRWDFLFYRGELAQHEVAQIRCIQPCPTCYLSWFDLPLSTFESQRLYDLVQQGLLDHQQVIEQKLALLSANAPTQPWYITQLGFTACYAQVECGHCHSRHLLVLGLGETQPGLYAGQLHGIWKVQ